MIKQKEREIGGHKWWRPCWLVLPCMVAVLVRFWHGWAWERIGLRREKPLRIERERESHPSVAHSGRWRWLRFGYMKLGHQHSICSTVGLISSSLSPFVSVEHISLWFIDILLVWLLLCEKYLKFIKFEWTFSNIFSSY